MRRAVIFTGCPVFFGEHGHYRLELAIEFSAEAASKRENNYAHIHHRYFENARELPLHHIGILTARPDGNLAFAHLRDSDMRPRAAWFTGGELNVLSKI